MQGREELFERDRHSEPVPGWHSCDLACASLEAVDYRPSKMASTAFPRNELACRVALDP